MQYRSTTSLAAGSFEVKQTEVPSPPARGRTQAAADAESNSSIGGSILRKLQGVKDASAQIARARSFKRYRSASRGPSTADGAWAMAAETSLSGLSVGGGRDSDQSASEVRSVRPSVFHSNSEPVWPVAIEDNHPSRTPAAPQLVPAMSASPEPEPTLLTVEQRCASSTAEQPTKEEPASPVAQDSSMLDVVVPQLLQQGVPMLKVSAKKQKRYIFKLDPDQGQVVWESKKHRIIPIENIKELREGADARYYREQFQLSPSFEDRWLTIVYVLDGRYKTLHLIAGTRDVFQMWDITLRRLYAIRQKLMSGLGHADIRQAVWEKQFWRSAAGEVAEGADNKLDFDEVERMCRRLNISPSREDLMIRFKQADTHNRGYLDFSDFQRFVKALKARPEVDSLYWRLASDGGGAITFEAFERFMRTSQKFDQSEAELQRIFLRYASSSFTVGYSSAPSSPQQDILDLGVQSSSQTEISALSTTSPEADRYSPPSSIAPTYSTSSASFLTVETAVMTLKGFTTFLLSTDNSAFVDQHGKIYHDMTRPLPEYYVSSSHNTYLVGHQLVGESTIEGYIRALLHSCRSVELDIYDGDVEPVIYHGRTLTTKVALRDTCAAINKYAFVSSPYPIIISAEIHCSLHQQDMIASIMRKEFGDALINAPIDGRPRVDVLPSPEDLKGRVLLKAKNLYVSESDALQEKEVVVDTESSSTETSASDMDPGDELKQGRRTARENEADVIKDLKSEFRKARNVLGRVRSPRRELTRALSLSPQGDVLDMTMPRQPAQKVKMSLALVALLVYTVGVKCRGLNKKEIYAPEHMFSLSEKTANRMMRQGMMDLIKHNRTHLVRIYPKGTRIGSTNFEPHRYWSAGAQLVAINWQTFDLGYMINRAMFQRNGRAGYVLKPLALRNADKQLLSKQTSHSLEVTIISAQQLPRQKDSLGREIVDRSTLDPFVEVSVHVPDWTHAPYQSQGSAASRPQSPSRDVPSSASASTSQPAAISARTVTCRTGVIRNNGFNPVWEQHLSLPFDLVGDMRDLVFVRFAVMHDGALEDEPLAVYCASLGSLNMGYRHLPLHDAQLSQYLFSTLFVRLEIRDR